MTEYFYVETELVMVERFYVVTEYFMSRQSVAKVKRFYVAKGKLCCDMVGQAGKISVVT